MTKERFNEIWNAATGGPQPETTEQYETNGMSDRLASAINSATEEGRSLALTDWDEADI